MSRRISNPKLSALLKSSHMALHDLSAIVGVSRQKLNSYSRGQPRPVLERKLARVLRVSIPELRGLLGIKQQPGFRRRSKSYGGQVVRALRRGDFAGQNRRKTHAAIAAESELFDEACASLRAYNVFEPIYRWANGRGRWVNGGGRFEAIPLVQSLIPIAQAHPRANIIRTRRGEFAVEVVRKTHRRMAC